MIRPICRRLLHRFILGLGFRLERVKPFERVIRNYELQHGDFYFIQIGAYNGVTSDPFVRFLLEGVWSGVLVEPQPQYFQVLTSIYGDRPDIQCRQVAIGESDGSSTLYRVRDDVPDLPHWASQLASFRREVIESHADRIPGVAEMIETQNVKTLTLATLVREAELPRLDLLAVDVEGYDFQVLKQIDQLKSLPQFIFYEHTHLSHVEYQHSLQFLVERGYSTETVNDGDTFARMNVRGRG